MLSGKEIRQGFIDYFKDCAISLINVVDENRLHLYSKRKETALFSQYNNKIQEFAEQTKLRHYYLNNDQTKFLNRRELECLLYTLQGYTATEVANILNISHKTVEGYIRDVKAKLCCNKKSELFKKAVELRLISIANLL